MTELYNMEEIEAVQGKGQRNALSQGENSLVEDIEKALAEMNTAKESAEAAKVELDRLIAEKLHDGVDPFVAMMNAMLYVVPQLMKYKEEKLVEKTASYEYINSLNAYMAETENDFARASDASDPQNASNGNGSYQHGTTVGLESGRAYEANLKTLGSSDLFAGLPSDVAAVMNGSISEILGLKGFAPNANKWAANSQNARTQYSLTETVWSGLNAPKWRMENVNSGLYSDNLYNVAGGQKDANYKYFADPNGDTDVGISEANYLSSQLMPVVDQAVTQNAVMLSTLNGYSKKVESEFKFEMENYNSITSLNALMYSDQIDLNDTHITRLRAK